MDEEFIIERYVATIHLDFLDIDEVFIAIDTKHRLVVVHDEKGEEEDSKLYRTKATLTSDETFRLAKRLKISVAKLPDYISEYYDFKEYFDSGIIEEIFQDILELLLELGAHFRVDYP